MKYKILMHPYTDHFRAPAGVILARLLFCAHVDILALTSAFAQQPFDPAQGIVLRGTVVTMDAAGTILHKGSVLVRNGKIVATWEGPQPPQGTPVDNAVEIDLGPKALIFPGLINLHNHPTYNMLDLWPAPSSHVQSGLGRPLGTEPYANRYQWNIVVATSPPEFRRLVDSPQALLVLPIGLNLYPEVGKYSEVKAMLGGETAFEGGPSDPATDNILIRNVSGLLLAQPAPPKFNPPKNYYLALGDSVTYGYQRSKVVAGLPPSGFNTGYVDDFGARLRQIRPGDEAPSPCGTHGWIRPDGYHRNQ